jgi:hypothetical protein
MKGLAQVEGRCDSCVDKFLESGLMHKIDREIEKHRQWKYECTTSEFKCAWCEQKQTVTDVEKGSWMHYMCLGCHLPQICKGGLFDERLAPARRVMSFSLWIEMSRTQAAKPGMQRSVESYDGDAEAKNAYNEAQHRNAIALLTGSFAERRNRGSKGESGEWGNSGGQGNPQRRDCSSG